MSDLSVFFFYFLKEKNIFKMWRLWRLQPRTNFNRTKRGTGFLWPNVCHARGLQDCNNLTIRWKLGQSKVGSCLISCSTLQQIFVPLLCLWLCSLDNWNNRIFLSSFCSHNCFYSKKYLLREIKSHVSISQNRMNQITSNNEVDIHYNNFSLLWRLSEAHCQKNIECHKQRKLQHF